MSKEKIQSAIMSILKIYVILMVFIIPQEKTGLVIWGSILAAISMYLFFQIFKTKKIRIERWFLICWIFMLGIVSIDVIFSKYSVSKLIQNTLQLMVVSLAVIDSKEGTKPKIDLFYITMTILLALNMINTYLQSEVLTFTNFADTNYASVIVFLYFMYCFNNKHKIGIAISIFYLIINFSRLYVIGLLAFILISIIKLILKNAKNTENKLTTKKVFTTLLEMLIFTMFLSYFWINFIVGSSTTSYKESFNDTSNAIRMNANINTLNVIKGDINLLWRGYDSDIKFALGLDDDLIENHPTYDGYRIVQPHNSFLNPFLTYGEIYTILYFLILSRILSELINMKNINLWVPYFIMCLFMHSLLTQFFLVLFVIALKENKEIGKKEKKYNISQEEKNEDFSSCTSKSWL